MTPRAMSRRAMSRRAMNTLCAALFAISAAACSSEPDAPQQEAGGTSAGAGAAGGGGNSGDASEPDGPNDGLVYLTPTQHLTRASIALRGLRPSRDELEAVAEDPNWVPAIIDYYLTTPELGAMIREMHEEALLTGVDPVIYPAGFPAIGALAGRDMQEINTSIVQAPVRLIEHVVMNDRPYTEIVTADYTLADDAVATVWGLPYDANGDTWQETHYDDGRAHAGVLSDSFLFTRHSTTYSNKNRGRANLVSRALLCYDFLSREIPIESDIDLADPEAVANAVENNPVCSSCHESLDPLAANFSSLYPIYVPSDLDRYPFATFAPTFRTIFRVTEPGFFGQPTNDLAELGARIAEDPRFSLCAAKRFYSFLAQMDVNEVPADLAGELEETFVDSGMDAKALLKAVVMSDAFRVSHATTEQAGESIAGLKHLRPSALGRIVQELTGYTWRTRLPLDIGTGGQVGDIDLMEDSFFGFEVLAGGIDGNSVTRPSTTTSATVALVAENLAARASKFVVEADLAEANADRRRLLRLVEPDTTDDASIRVQIADLSLLFYGELLDPYDTAVSDAAQLFANALAAGTGSTPAAVERAWQLTLYAMLQDPRMLHY